MNSISIIYSTAPDQKTAERLAQELVGKNLAACVQIDGPIQSIYPWKGNIEQEEEYRLTIKALTEKYPQIEEYILQHHPYDTPEIISVPIQHVAQRYQRWMIDETKRKG